MKIKSILLLASCSLLALAACKNEPADTKTAGSKSSKATLKGFWYQYTNNPEEPKVVYEFDEAGNWHRYIDTAETLSPATYTLDSVKLKLDFAADQNHKEEFLVDALSDSLLVLEAMDGPLNGQTLVFKHWGDHALPIANIEGVVGKDPLINQSFKTDKRSNILVRIQSDRQTVSADLVNKGGALLRGSIRSAWASELLPGEYILKIVGSLPPSDSKDKTPSQGPDAKYSIRIDQIK